MAERKVRIGIDVGGTFTDAVAIDDASYEIIAKEKILTTHESREGIAKGIVDIIEKLLKCNNIPAKDVVFIAHGTTQATNALLEGDVADAGIIAMGSGIESFKVKSDTDTGDIELAKGKFLRTIHRYVETNSAEAKKDEINSFLDEFKNKGIEVVVASEAFSVDDSANECKIMEMAAAKGLYATGGHEVSQLYGLKVRTRTAVINASLIPKMMKTADMTESCVKRSGIGAELMIMRCDGGVMTVNEVRKRPILTMLSGLAAGVAGALMYERVSDGIFFEAGGTSTDISVIKNGRVMIKYACVGGHKTYLNSLDVRTLGIAGGSMIKVENGKIVDVGPRSAHIAGKRYEAFADASEIDNPAVKLIAPKENDESKFAVIECSGGKSFSLTLAGAANVCGAVPKGDYAEGDKAAARKAWEAFAKFLGISVEEAAAQVMDIAAAKVRAIVEELVKDYELNPNLISLVGGGGSGGVLVPYLAGRMGYKWSIAKDAPYISTIGVALAMVREVVERTVLNPDDSDIASIRRDVFDRIVKSGAGADTVEIAVEIDRRANILRAVATGAAELRTRDLSQKSLDEDSLKKIAADSMGVDIKDVSILAGAGKWRVFRGIKIEKKFFIFTKKHTPVRVIDREGIVRLQKNFGEASVTKKAGLLEELASLIDLNTDYSDAGGKLPHVFVYYGEKQLDLSGLAEKSQIISVAKMELERIGDDEDIAVVVTK
ncbi:MAG: hydantoinase [Candidatus Wallbacteria bacterium GWC2_49_35]|uniref:Hydantoinase n=1 Tax=Candidatus Wallbacteria bacterium GWC2_49_35 TaxID=1817813 RepID=A0A1F7WPP1_9BACT|nr:MAG: hydantoinase [Candidatus Wallbacteria bacterium GWC2_49_35]HBC75053.1 hydantoinase [Candidatus Wallbacteria bacterium]